ncbi:Cyclin-like [Phytophthora cactorum]|nr:Cyclin-like [Phytophthora cactorum]
MTATSSDWIFSEQELRSTPSQRDGMKYTDELVVRRKACDFIEKMAKALDLPKLAQISADNYLHRFYMRQSLVRYDNFLVAAACVLLGSKAEESPKKIGYVAKEYIAVRKKHDPQAIAGKIISMEGVVLHNLAYELTLSHPYKYINEKVDKVVRLQHLSEQETKIQSSKIKQCLHGGVFATGISDLAAGAVYLAGLYESYVPEDLCTANGLPGGARWRLLFIPCKMCSFPICLDAARYLLNAYTVPYIETNVLAAGLSKLVYMFHPPKSVESPASFVELDVAEHEHSSPMVSSPMDSAACVTSPECGSSQGRSPYDHDFDHDVKSHVKDSEESPRETAQVPATPASLLDSFPIANDSSSADKLLGSTAAARAASNGRLSRKRGKEAENTFCSGKKFKYCL